MFGGGETQLVVVNFPKSKKVKQLTKVLTFSSKKSQRPLTTVAVKE